MYVPKLFQVNDSKTIKDFMRQHEFALVISAGEGSPVASHLLVEVQEDGEHHIYLNGHMARNNPQWRMFTNSGDVLAVFQGPHTYVSPNWYSVRAVPTWNYLAVHAYGQARLIDNHSELYDLLERLVERHERATNAISPYRLADIPRDFIDNMMQGIVGFQIAVSKIEASFKLSQNRNDNDYERIILELKKRKDENSHAIATAMERSRKDEPK